MGVTTDRLNEAMRLRGMRQIDVLKALSYSSAEEAAQYKITSGMMTEYCKGRSFPKGIRLNVLAQALQVNPAWLLGADVPMQENTPANQIAGIVHRLRSDAEFCQLVDDECKLTRSQLSAVRVVVSSLLGNDDSKQ